MIYLLNIHMFDNVDIYKKEDNHETSKKTVVCRIIILMYVTIYSSFNFSSF